MEQNNPDSLHPVDKAALPRPVVLVFLDGRGIGQKYPGNAFSDLKLKTLDKLINNYPVALLTANGKSAAERYQILGARGLLTETLSKAGLSLLNITESEKLTLAWHHFNGGRERNIMGEELRVISSKTGNRQEDPAQVLPEIIKLALKDIKNGIHDFLIISLSNLDLVSASGNLKATQDAAKLLDKGLGRIIDAVLKHNGLLVITAAYGRAEAMINMSTELPQTGITDNPVPLMIVSRDYEGKTIGLPDVLGSDLSLVEPSGTFEDVVPTILKILNITPPENIPGESLI